MLGFVCGLVLITITSAVPFASQPFEDFAAQYGKSYASADEAAHRRVIFEANLRKIAKHNADPRWTYTLAVNEFADLTGAEFAAMYASGTKRSLPELELGAVHDGSADVAVADLPKSVDWRTKNVTTEAKNQGACGSCWAFSTAETLESHIAIATGKLMKFSEQEFVSCAPNPQQCGGTGGCQGSVQPLGFKYAIEHGITLDTSYPYTAKTGTCEPENIKPVATITGYKVLPTNNYSALMNAVANIGPIAISAAAEPWQMYHSGVFNGDCGFDVDHAIQLVGYGTEEAPPPAPPSVQCPKYQEAACKSNSACHWCTYFCSSSPCASSDTVSTQMIAHQPLLSADVAFGDYWLVRNSWGTQWGENGYIRIKRFGSTSTEPCISDTTPADGYACMKPSNGTAPKSLEVCGLCGLMSSSSYPTGGKLV